VIEAAGLTRRFAQARSLGGFGPPRAAALSVLKGISLEVPGGGIVGIVGANGSGKSTLLRVLAGLVTPDSGTARVAGRDPVKDRVGVARVAALLTGEERAFYLRLTARHNLELFAALSDVPPGAATARADEVLERVGLGYAADRRVAAYSSGMRQRLGMARALLRRPEALLLDELTRALDDEGTETLWGIVAEEAARGASVLATATRAPDLEGRCDRVLALEGGVLS
jgi:ABC-type multidrug transport system ATPase subunit